MPITMKTMLDGVTRVGRWASVSILFGVMAATAEPVVTSAPANEGWEFKQDKDGIQTFVRDVPGTDIKDTRAIVRIPSSLASVLAVFDDSASCPHWRHLCAEAYDVEKLSVEERYVYNRNDLPWPAGDRDVVMHMDIQIDTENERVRIVGKSVKDKLPLNKKVTRMDDVRIDWVIQQASDGTVEVIMDTFADPQGLPTGMVNSTALKTARITMERLREWVKQPKYQQACIEVLSGEAETCNTVVVE